MFCTKCGKEIDDSAKFCKYCGSPVEVVTEEPLETSSDMDTDVEVSEEPVFQPKNRKKWVVPVCIAAGIAVLGGMGVLAANMAKAEKEAPKKVVAEKKEEPKKEEQTAEPEAEKEPEATYPKDITLDTEVQNKVTEFITLLGSTDCKMGGLNSDKGKGYDGFAFLYMSIYNKIPFLNGSPVENQTGDRYTWKVPEQDVVNYLKNSIGTTEYETIQGASAVIDGKICIQPFDPGSMWTVDAPVVNKMIAVSENDVEIQGTIRYSTFEGEEENNQFDIVLTANPESMWGGYTLKEIKNWGEEQTQSAEGVDEQTLQNEMKKFVEILGYCDNNSFWIKDKKSLPGFSSADLSKSFLFMVTDFYMITGDDNEIMKKYGLAELKEGVYCVSEETAKQILTDSIGQYDNSTMEFAGNMVKAVTGNLGTSGVAITDITNIANISDTDIKVDGIMTFHREGVTVRNVSFSITMTANPESIWGGYTLKSIDKWEEANVTVQNTDEQPESALGEYLVFLVNAVNSGDYTGADEVMLKGSSLYQEQEALVKKLHSENTTEKLKTWSVLEKEQLDGTHARITSDEVIEVTYAGGNSKTLYQSYVYTCELTESGWLFTSISAVE